MPPTANLKQNQIKEIEALKKKLASQNRQLVVQNEELGKAPLRIQSRLTLTFSLLAELREAAKVRELDEKDNRILAPEGQAGRSQGYNLFEEMRVSKETYLSLRVWKFFSVFHSSLMYSTDSGSP
jgi:hypothetical protein